MRRGIGLLLLGATLIATPAKLQASEAWAFRVYQPFNLPDGIAVSPVTYTGYYGPGQEVEMTCWPNRVWHPTPDWRGVTRKAIQENLAFTTRLKVTVDWARSWPTRGDTISAALDVTRLASMSDTIEWADTTLLSATVECMKSNAGQYAPEVQFLALRIRGPRRYSKYGGIYDVRNYKCGPKERQFQ